MNLFIQVKDGNPFEHPIFEDNFRDAFPDVDVDNLPPEFSRFERIAQPAFDIYEVYEGVSYQKVGGVYKDVHQVRGMTTDEIAVKQQETKDQWAISPNWASWTFNEETCSYDPLVAMPNDGTAYIWDESTTSWIEEQ